MEEEKKNSNPDNAKAVRASEFAWKVIEDVFHTRRLPSKRAALDEIIKTYLLYEKTKNDEFKK